MPPALSLRDVDGGDLLRRREPAPRCWRRSGARATLLRGRWHGEQFSVGALTTTRREVDGGASNRVAGLDLDWWPNRAQRWSARAMASRTATTPSAGRGGHHLRRTAHAHDGGWNLTAEATEISPRFRNDNGFLEQTGVRIRRPSSSGAGARWRCPAVRHPGPRVRDLPVAQHRSTLADGAQAAGQTVLRYLRPGLWLLASHTGPGCATIRCRARAPADRAAQHELAGGRLHGEPGALVRQAQCRSAARPQARRRCRSCRPQRTLLGEFNLRHRSAAGELESDSAWSTPASPRPTAGAP